MRITTTIKSCICKQNSMHELEIIFIKKKMYEEIKIISRKIRDTHTLGLPPTSMVKPGAGEEQQTDLSHMTLVLSHARSPTNGDQLHQFPDISLTLAVQCFSLTLDASFTPTANHPHSSSSLTPHLSPSLSSSLLFTLTLHSPPLTPFLPPLTSPNSSLSPSILTHSLSSPPFPLTHASASWSNLSREQFQCSSFLVPHCQPQHSLPRGQVLPLPYPIHLLPT